MSFIPSAASTLDLVERSRSSLVEAAHAREVSQRYLQAQLAALRAAAALVAARSTPGSHGGPRNLWDLLPGVAPELREWADFFARSTALRAGIEQGRVVVSVRDADDQLRQAETFVETVVAMLGLPGHTIQAGVLTPTVWA